MLAQSEVWLGGFYGFSKFEGAPDSPLSMYYPGSTIEEQEQVVKSRERGAREDELDQLL